MLIKKDVFSRSFKSRVCDYVDKTGRIKKSYKFQYLTSPAVHYQALPVEDVMAASKSEFADWGKDDSQMNWGPVVDDYADLPFLPLPPLQVRHLPS